ncbi:TadE/TadG family type IV pilus assembly protein [Noviherbaspirillum sp. 1P10PC]|uniref:TadE/TadG family type IV pilus assembly protein n=1 Tax=Noviherbaspirillum sp. 1P10PC TaxID=3132292 RepID=UPI00399F11F4
MKFLCKQKGVAAVELGILLFPLLLLTFGVTELGRAFYQYNSLAKATRDAVRFLSSQGPGDAVDLATAKCLAVYGKRTCSGSVLLPGLTQGMVTVCDSSNCADHLNQSTTTGVINLVTVTITGYPFSSMVPFLVPDITFGPISTTMRQVL